MQDDENEVKTYTIEEYILAVMEEWEKKNPDKKLTEEQRETLYQVACAKLHMMFNLSRMSF